MCWVGYFGSTGLEYDLELKLTFDLILCENRGWEAGAKVVLRGRGERIQLGGCEVRNA